MAAVSSCTAVAAQKNLQVWRRTVLGPRRNQPSELLCATTGSLRRVSLSVTTSIVLAAAHSNATDTSTDMRGLPKPLEVSVSHACPCPFPHEAMVSEVALRKAAHALAFTALHVINAHLCASRRERRYRIRLLFACKELCDRKFHLWSTPLAFPFCGTYDVPRQSSAPCNAL